MMSVQGVGEQLVDAAVAGELRPLELAQADLVVQHRPQRAIGEAAVELVVVAPRQVDGDDGDRSHRAFGGCRRRWRRPRRSSRTRRRPAVSARPGRRRRGHRRWARLPGWGRHGWRRRPGGTRTHLMTCANPRLRSLYVMIGNPRPCFPHEAKIVGGRPSPAMTKRRRWDELRAILLGYGSVFVQFHNQDFTPASRSARRCRSHSRASAAAVSHVGV